MYMGPAVLNMNYYNPYVTQGAGHGSNLLCRRGAGHSLNPLYMGCGYAAAMTRLYSGIPSATGFGPVDRDGSIDKLTKSFAKLRIGKRERSVMEKARGEVRVSDGASLERYEENLCLLMQEFEIKARHEYVLTGEWPKPECEEAALRLSSRLEGVEWRKVCWRPGYMEELDLLWRAKVDFVRRDKVYQVVWEFVAGMARRWVSSADRHRHCYEFEHDGNDNRDKLKDALYLERAPSVRRENKYFLPGGPTPRDARGFLRRWTRKSA